jgi:uncharacterized protein (DUF608 family)
MHSFGGPYDGEHLNHVAFPLGGIGAGMLCVEGTGAISHVSLKQRPSMFHEPQMYAAVCIRGDADSDSVARVLEGPVPRRKVFGGPLTGLGLGDRTYGFPRLSQVSFAARMPFAEVAMSDPGLPLGVKLVAWSPFVPTDADASSLPVAALEYELTNTSGGPIEGVFSYHTVNPVAMSDRDVAPRRIRAIERGAVLHQPARENAPHEEASFALVLDEDDAAVDAAWFRGGWFDAKTMVWRRVEACEAHARPPHAEGDCGNGASVYAPFRLAAGASRTFRLLMAWYVPHTLERYGGETPDHCSSGAGGGKPAAKPKHQPWYTGRFPDVDAVMTHWRGQYAPLRDASATFASSLHDSTLPPQAIEAAAANLTILKSPTVLRDREGRIWAWEGCGDTHGSCHGTCTHVWNYAQAMPHLFASLERTVRQTEFGECQDDAGRQVFRAPLPIRPAPDFGAHAAADGQLGGIMKVHRDWRISGDTVWLRRLWPAVRQSLDYCIQAWDPTHEGMLKEPHHNTYDIEFWGANGMCTSFYLGALRAATLMGEALGDDVTAYDELYRKGREAMQRDLFNGEYFHQQVQWEGLRAKPDQFIPLLARGHAHPEGVALLKAEGPKYQYGTGCLSDGVLGAWMALVCAVGDVLDRDMVRSHLLAVYRHNLKHDLSQHVNPQRSSYALGDEGGLLLCSWPRGGKPSLPFVYSDEVWTGIEYQVAAHLIALGCVDEGLDIVRTARQRYDGRHRNPFNEYECGHWYARALSSYALLGALSGASYDAVTRTLTLEPRVAGDFTAFFSAADGFGQVGVRDGKPFLDVRYGRIEVDRLEFRSP